MTYMHPNVFLQVPPAANALPAAGEWANDLFDRLRISIFNYRLRLEPERRFLFFIQFWKSEIWNR